MAVNSSRSCNGDLAEGMSDGTYSKVVTRERGGEIDAATYAARTQLHPAYGITEAATKILGDGTAHRTPLTVATPSPRSMRW